MSNRTWVGGNNNNANDASNWSPDGRPIPGDMLDMQAGTMNVRGNNLAGDTIVIGKEQVGAEPTLNLSHHANVSLEIAQFSRDQVTVNVQGSDTLNVRTDFPSSGLLTVNLADHASLAGAFNMTFGNVVINGGDGSRFVNDSSTVLRGLHMILDTDVKGTGSFTVGTAQGSGGRLEFGGAVSRGQSVEVSADPGRSLVSQVQIDHPDTLKGSVGLGIFAEVNLMGLTGADSYQLKNDILSIYSGCTVIDRLRLTLPPSPSGFPSDVTVKQTSTGIAIDRGRSFDISTLLPVHHPYGSGSV